MRRILFESVQ
jgi:hypothetical protein